MFPWRCDNFSFDSLLHCHLATASANHISPISRCICIFINIFTKPVGGPGHKQAHGTRIDFFYDKQIKTISDETVFLPLTSFENLVAHHVTFTRLFLKLPKLSLDWQSWRGSQMLTSLRFLNTRIAEVYSN